MPRQTLDPLRALVTLDSLHTRVALLRQHRPVISLHRDNIGVPSFGHPCRTIMEHGIVQQVTGLPTPQSLECHSPVPLRTRGSDRPLRTLRAVAPVSPFTPGMPLGTLDPLRALVTLDSLHTRVALLRQHRPVISLHRDNIGVPSFGHPCRTIMEHGIVQHVTGLPTPQSLECHSPVPPAHPWFRSGPAGLAGLAGPLPRCHPSLPACPGDPGSPAGGSCPGVALIPAPGDPGSPAGLGYLGFPAHPGRPSAPASSSHLPPPG